MPKEYIIAKEAIAYRRYIIRPQKRGRISLFQGHHIAQGVGQLGADLAVVGGDGGIVGDDGGMLGDLIHRLAHMAGIAGTAFSLTNFAIGYIILRYQLTEKGVNKYGYCVKLGFHHGEL